MARKIKQYKFQVDSNYEVRHTQLRGKSYLVVPVVMIREGVHAGSAGPILHIAEELRHYPESWNGIPVVIYHPEQDGEPTSANTPYQENFAITGRVYNTRYENGRLRAEAWIEESRLDAISQKTKEYLESGQPIDVSVGVYTDDEFKEGEWNGEHYVAIAHNYRPDHLALLPDAEGACNWNDGCGVRTNQTTKGGRDVNNVPKTYRISFNGTETSSWSAPSLGDFGVSSSQWSELSQTEKAKVASHFLIGTASAETYGDLHFPVVNPRTDKLNERALRAVIGGRGAQLTSVSASVRDRARRQAYRLLNSEFDAGLTIPQSLSTAMKQLAQDGFAVIEINQQGYGEIMQTIQHKLDGMDTDAKLHFLTEVYDETFIYEIRFPNGNRESEMYQRSYSVNDNGDIEFTGEPQQVTRKVEYVTMQREDKTMQRTKKKGKPMQRNTSCDAAKVVQALIDSDFTVYTSDDQKWLESLSDERRQELITQEAQMKQFSEQNQNHGNPSAGEDDPEKGNDAPVQMDAKAALDVLKSGMKNEDDYINLLPDSIQEQVRYGLKIHKQRRTQLIESITANSSFTDQDLKDQDIEYLEKLAVNLSKPEDYSLNGNGTHFDSPDDQDDEILFPAGFGQPAEDKTAATN